MLQTGGKCHSNQIATIGKLLPFGSLGRVLCCIISSREEEETGLELRKKRSKVQTENVYQIFTLRTKVQGSIKWQELLLTALRRETIRKLLHHDLLWSMLEHCVRARKITEQSRAQHHDALCSVNVNMHLGECSERNTDVKQGSSHFCLTSSLPVNLQEGSQQHLAPAASRSLKGRAAQQRKSDENQL